mgnify:CR=1 FL=1
MSKICERVALNQLIAYMKNKKRLTEHQSGNKAQHSTETLNVMMTDNYKFLEEVNKMLTLTVLLICPKHLRGYTMPNFQSNCPIKH